MWRELAEEARSRVVGEGRGVVKGRLVRLLGHYPGFRDSGCGSRGMNTGIVGSWSRGGEGRDWRPSFLEYLESWILRMGV